jgi:hypothetical protein
MPTKVKPRPATRVKAKRNGRTVVAATTARTAKPTSLETPPDLGLNNQPWTTEERLEHIKALGERIQAYVHFMGKVSGMPGTSAESRDRAVEVFYDRLVIAERQLGRVQEDLELG